MSGYVIAQEADAVHLFTDGGVFDNDGRMIGTSQKVMLLTQMPAACTILGYRGWGLVLLGEMQACPSLDYFLSRAEIDLPKLLPGVAAYAEKEGADLDFEMVIGGWSDRLGRLACYLIGNGATSGGTWKPVELTEPMNNPPPPEEALDRLRPADGFVLPRDGLLAMKAQREFRHPGKGYSVVGGFVQHTIVTRDSVASKIVHRWPDELV